MKCPDGWPFETWVDIDTLKQDSSPLGQLIYQATVRYLSGPLRDFFDNIWPGKPESDQFLFGLTDNAALGARVARAKSPAKYAITLEAGSWLQLLLVLSRILADPRNIPEQSDKPIPPLAERYALMLLLKQEFVPRFGGRETSPGVDLGKKRSDCLNQILFYGAMFLILHEAGHIADRHLDYWLELRSKNGLRQTSDQRAGMEYLADKWALTAGAAVLNDYDAEQYYLFGFAIAVCLSIIDQLVSNSTQDSGFYPTGSDRLLLMEAVASATLRQEPKKLRLVEGIREAKASWRRMGWSTSEPTVRLASVDGLIDKIKELDSALEAHRAPHRPSKAQLSS